MNTARKILIITNNSRVVEKFNYATEVLVADTYEGVLLAARDYVHRGYLLVTHPLAGSLKPNQTPFRTIFLERTADGKLDISSVLMMESAIETFQKFMEIKPCPQYNAKVKEDFKTVDLSLAENAIAGKNFFTGMLSR
ncbi:MAG: GrdX family protein [Lachnospiraceae bacterium]